MDGFKLLFGDEQGSEGHLETVLKEHTHGVLLFDEMEKAYRPLLLNFLHQLDKGTIRLGKNTRYSLKNFFFIFTTNIGGAEIIQEMSAGMPWDYVLSSMDVLLKKELKPEFLGRFDEVFVFKALSDENQRKIAGKYLEFYTNHYKKLHHEISFDNDIVNFIVLHGYNDTLGARPMKQATLKFISGAINEQMEKGISHVKGMLKRDDRNQRLYISSIN